MKSCGERNEEGEEEILEVETHAGEPWLGLPFRGLCDRASSDSIAEMHEARLSREASYFISFCSCGVPNRSILNISVNARKGNCGVLGL